MSFVSRHPYLTGFAVVALIVFLHVVSIVLLALDFRSFLEVLRIANSYDDVGSGTRPVPAFMKGLEMPEGLAVKPGELVSSLYPSNGSTQKRVSDQVIQEHAGDFSPALLSGFEQEMPRRFRAEMEKLSALPVGPASANALASAASAEALLRGRPAPFREIREIGRFWYVIGRLLARQRKAEAAVGMQAAVCLLPVLLEAEEPRGVSLLTRMIGLSMRKIGATGLCEVLPLVNLSKEQAKTWIEYLQKLDQAVGPFASVLETEKRFLSDALSPQGIEALVRRYPQISAPHRLARLVQSRWFQEELNAFYDPIIAACNQPWAMADKEFSARMRALEDRQMRLFDLRPGNLLYLFLPERFFGEMLIVISAPNLYRAHRHEREVRQTLVGAQAVMGINAYFDEFRRFPVSLTEVEQWLGVTFPADQFSEKPLEYSVGSQPRLLSVGADMAPNTDDDLVFMPLPN